jgi:hypothetical protein
MAIQIQGNGGSIAEVDGTTFRAQRVTSRPIDYAGLGSYSWGAMTGILPAALGANSEIWQFRWADATRIALITKITMSACVTTTFFAAGVPVQIDLVKSTGWTVAGTLGTGLTPAALLKKRTSMGATLMTAGDARISTTAALGAGTKTLEGAALACLLAPGPITASLNGQIIPPGTVLYEAATGDGGEHPIALVQNEGLSIRSVAVPATGTWQACIRVDWTEVAAY